MPIKKYFLFLSVIFAGVIVVMALQGYWPVAFVNSSPIFDYQFKGAYAVAYNYYLSSLKAAKEDPVILKSEEIQKEIRQTVFESLIEQKLIRAELANEIKSKDLADMLERKINSGGPIDSENFKKGVELLYGVSADEFKNIVLIPQAESEIFEGRLILQNKNMDDWINEKVSKADVKIVMPGFYWSSEGIKAK